MTFNIRMKQYIEFHGITKQRVASVAGVTPSAFFRFLNGSSTMKSSVIEKLNLEWPEMIAYALNINYQIAFQASKIKI